MKYTSLKPKATVKCFLSKTMAVWNNMNTMYLCCVLQQFNKIMRCWFWWREAGERGD